MATFLKRIPAFSFSRNKSKPGKEAAGVGSAPEHPEVQETASKHDLDPVLDDSSTIPRSSSSTLISSVPIQPQPLALSEALPQIAKTESLPGSEIDRIQQLLNEKMTMLAGFHDALWQKEEVGDADMKDLQVLQAEIAGLESKLQDLATAPTATVGSDKPNKPESNRTQSQSTDAIHGSLVRDMRPTGEDQQRKPSGDSLDGSTASDSNRATAADSRRQSHDQNSDYVAIGEANEDSDPEGSSAEEYRDRIRNQIDQKVVESTDSDLGNTKVVESTDSDCGNTKVVESSDSDLGNTQQSVTECYDPVEKRIDHNVSDVAVPLELTPKVHSAGTERKNIDDENSECQVSTEDNDKAASKIDTASEAESASDGGDGGKDASDEHPQLTSHTNKVAMEAKETGYKMTEENSDRTETSSDDDHPQWISLRRLTSVESQKQGETLHQMSNSSEQQGTHTLISSTGTASVSNQSKPESDTDAPIEKDSIKCSESRELHSNSSALLSSSFAQTQARDEHGTEREMNQQGEVVDHLQSNPSGKNLQVSPVLEESSVLFGTTTKVDDHEGESKGHSQYSLASVSDKVSERKEQQSASPGSQLSHQLTSSTAPDSKMDTKENQLSTGAGAGVDEQADNSELVNEGSQDLKLEADRWKPSQVYEIKAQLDDVQAKLDSKMLLLKGFNDALWQKDDVSETEMKDLSHLQSDIVELEAEQEKLVTQHAALLLMSPPRSLGLKGTDSLSSLRSSDFEHQGPPQLESHVSDDPNSREALVPAQQQKQQIEPNEVLSETGSKPEKEPERDSSSDTLAASSQADELMARNHNKKENQQQIEPNLARNEPNVDSRILNGNQLGVADSTVQEDGAENTMPSASMNTKQTPLDFQDLMNRSASQTGTTEVAHEVSQTEAAKPALEWDPNKAHGTKHQFHTGVAASDSRDDVLEPVNIHKRSSLDSRQILISQTSNSDSEEQQTQCDRQQHHLGRPSEEVTENRNEAVTSVSPGALSLMEPIFRAAASGDVSSLNKLVAEQGLSMFNAKGHTLAHAAAMYGAADTLEYLLEKDRGLLWVRDCSGAAPLHVAALAGHANIFAIEPQGDWNEVLSLQDQYGNSPLHIAAAAGFVEVVKQICTRAAWMRYETNLQGDSPAHCAAKHAKLPVRLQGVLADFGMTRDRMMTSA